MHAPDGQRTPGLAWTRIGFVGGIAASVAGNIGYTWHPTAATLAAAGTTADQWRPDPGAQIAAGFFPLALLVTVEILSRVQWPHNWTSHLARYGGAGLVAVVAGIVSYIHLRALLLAYNDDQLTATLGPLAVDGVMIVSGFALIAIGHATSRAPQTDRPAPAPPLPTTPEYEVSVLRNQERLELDPARAEAPRDYRSPRRPRPAMAVTDSPGRRRRRPQTAAAAASPTPPAPAAVPLEPDLVALLETARDQFGETLATGTRPSVNTLRKKLRVGHPKARALHDALATA